MKLYPYKKSFFEFLKDSSYAFVPNWFWIAVFTFGGFTFICNQGSRYISTCVPKPEQMTQAVQNVIQGLVLGIIFMIIAYILARIGILTPLKNHKSSLK